MYILVYKVIINMNEVDLYKLMWKHVNYMRKASCKIIIHANVYINYIMHTIGSLHKPNY
jgi:hypothetical protein